MKGFISVLVAVWVGGLTTPRGWSQASILHSFTGLHLNELTGGGAPPDTDGAIGPNHFAEFINGGFAIYNRTGTRQAFVSDTSFWNSAGISAATTNAGSGPTDPRILFDPASQRWFAIEINTADTSNQVLVARTSGIDPSIGQWKAVQYTGNTGFADFPTLGLDANGVYIGTNNFSAAGNGTGVSFTSIPKADLLLATPSLTRRATILDSSSTHGFTLQGVTNFGSPPGDGHGVVLATDNTLSTKLDRTTVNNPGAAGATLATVVKPTVATAAAPGLVHQPDQTQLVDGSDDRIGATVVQVGSLVYLCHGITAGTRDAIRLTVLNEATNAVVAEGTLSDGVHDFTYPSVAVNAAGTIVIGYTRSGLETADTNGDGFQDGNLSAFAAVAHVSGSAVVFDTQLLLKAGQTNAYHLFGGTDERWGDYSSTTLDPSDPNVFWTIQEYAISSGTNGEWGTWIAAISVPEPTVLPLGAMGAVLLLLARRRAR